MHSPEPCAQSGVPPSNPAALADGKWYESQAETDRVSSLWLAHRQRVRDPVHSGSESRRSSTTVTSPKSNRPEAGIASQEDATAVRSREQADATSRNTVPPPRAARRASSDEHTAVAPKKSGDSSDSVVVRRSQKLEEKARLAQRLLERLPPNDRRRRLLHAAILRRDEMLLDGFIEELGGR